MTALLTLARGLRASRNAINRQRRETRISLRAPRHKSLHCSESHKSQITALLRGTVEMHRSTNHNGGYGALTASSPSVFEENESCGDACARQLPSLEWVKAYDFAWLWNDVAGGVTLGLVLLAQSLAHAHLCGVAPIRGPYACLLAPLAYALLGTCHEASIGTGGLVSLVVSEQLAREYATPEERSARAATCALLVGLVLCVMGLLRLAFLVRFLSRPALSGFISGSALLIIKSMSGPMVGGHLPRPNDA